MKPNILITLFLGLFLAYSTAVSAQEESTDAIYKSVLKEYTLNPDGSWDYHYNHSLKILTYYAFHSLYGEDFIVYNPEYQKLKIHQSVTTMADGKKVASPGNAFNELLPSFAANAPNYNGLREMAVTHTGLEKGAIIDFDYTLSSSKDYSAGLMGNETFYPSSPAEKYTLVVHVPAGVPFHYSQYQVAEKPVIRKAPGKVTYTWELKNVPAGTREDFRLKDQMNRPRVVFSSARNSSKIFQSFSSQKAFAYECSPLLKERMEKLVKETRDPLKRMMSIQDIVVNEINYQPVPLYHAAFRVRTAAEVYQSNGGSEIEKAVLLASMLKAAGIQAEVVAVLPASGYDTKSSNLLQVERYLVQASTDEEDPYYLSPLQNDLSDQVFQLADKELVSLSIAKVGVSDPGKQPLAEVLVNASLKMDESMSMQGTVQVSLSGKLNPSLKIVQDSAYLKKLGAGVCEAAEIVTSNPGRTDRTKTVVQYEVKPLNRIKEISGHFIYKIPLLSAGVESWYMTELVQDRVEPLGLPSLISEKYQYSITLPEGMELITAEETLNIRKPFGFFSFSISQEGKEITIRKEIEFTSSVVATTDYSSLKEIMNAWNNKRYREIVIRKGPK